MNTQFLPFHWKIPGILLIAAGIILCFFYLFMDFRITLPVFAIYSSFLETKTFEIIQTNIADELILLVYLTGIFLVICSKEKIRDPEDEPLHSKAWIISFIINSVFLFLSVLFIYGTGFLVVMTINLFSVTLLYLIIFYFLKFRKRKRKVISQ